MANTKYNELHAALTDLQESATTNSESANARTCTQAQQLVWNSDLSEEERTTIYRAIGSAANPSGYYYDDNGIKAGLEALAAYSKTVEQQKTTASAFTHNNLAKLLSDGKIATVRFTKRSNGELRTMRCRVGVKKHLKGGAKSYSAKAHNLLTVFDMDARGYRTIPVDGVVSVATSGQVFAVA